MIFYELHRHIKYKCYYNNAVSEKCKNNNLMLNTELFF